MATYYSPRISDQDYPAFQNLPGLDLPATYEEWLQQQEHEKAHHEGNGDGVIEVDVTPAEFLTYCQAARTTCDLRELENFAMTKGPTAAATSDAPRR